MVVSDRAKKINTGKASRHGRDVCGDATGTGGQDFHTKHTQGKLPKNPARGVRWGKTARDHPQRHTASQGAATGRRKAGERQGAI